MVVYYKDFDKETNPILTEMGAGTNAGFVVIHLKDDPVAPVLSATVIDCKCPMVSRS